jgi:CBS domain containing-hemolysin-like protein
MAATTDGDDGAAPLDQSTPEPEQHPRERWLDRIRQRLGFRGASIRADLVDALETREAVSSGDFTPEERAMLRNILQLRGMRVEDVMVPRPDIVSVPIDTTLGVLLQHLETGGHSRLPVFAESLDDPRGMVHIKDVLAYLTKQAESEAGAAAPGRLDLGRVDLEAVLADLDIVRPVLFVPAAMPALDLLAKMQTTRVHMALVIDEYGGTDGLVTIEDLVETVVGDIEDEHDEAEVPLLVEDADGFVADARVPLEEVLKALGGDLDFGDAADEVDTLGGLLVTIVGRVPAVGEVFPGPGGWEYEVLDADLRRVKRIRLHRAPDSGESAGNGGRAVADSVNRAAQAP